MLTCFALLIERRHTKLPSQATVDVLHVLATVYDAYVYQPFLVDGSMVNTDSEAQLQLHGLYDAIMSLLTKHQQWCRSMRVLKKDHLKPALESILNTPTVVHSMIEDEAAMKAVDAVLHDPANPGYQPVSAEILRVLREKRSAQLLQTRAKRKFRREHTV